MPKHSTTAAPAEEDLDGLGWRAQRTRESILASSRKLFLERGYSGTRINNITDASSISRAGFYTYFKDKREVFNLLGKTAYDDVLVLVKAWDAMPAKPTLRDLEGWVGDYFTFMDVHGAFIFAAGYSTPDDDDVKSRTNRMQLRVFFLLGVALRGRQKTPTSEPEALGMVTLAALDQSWYQSTVKNLGVERADVVRALARMIRGSLSA